MKIYRVHTINQETLKAIEERFYSLEKLVELLNKKRAYYAHYNEPITEESIIENITDTCCADVIIPANKEEGLWEMMGFKNEDELLRIFELNIVQ